MRQLQGGAGVLLHQHDGHAGLVDFPQSLKNRLDQQRRQAKARFVQQQDARVSHQRPANRQHLLLAAAQRAGQLLAPLGQHRE